MRPDPFKVAFEKRSSPRNEAKDKLKFNSTFDFDNFGKGKLQNSQSTSHLNTVRDDSFKIVFAERN